MPAGADLFQQRIQRLRRFPVGGQVGAAQQVAEDGLAGVHLLAQHAQVGAKFCVAVVAVFHLAGQHGDGGQRRAQFVRRARREQPQGKNLLVAQRLFAQLRHLTIPEAQGRRQSRHEPGDQQRADGEHQPHPPQMDLKAGTVAGENAGQGPVMEHQRGVERHGDRRHHPDLSDRQQGGGDDQRQEQQRHEWIAGARR